MLAIFAFTWVRDPHYRQGSSVGATFVANLKAAGIDAN